MYGGTEKDFARQHVFLGLGPNGTKKTIEQIFRERRVNDNNLLVLAKLEADKMVDKRFLHYDSHENVDVFSKDDKGRYSWQPATLKDKVMNYVLNFLPN